MNQLAADVFVDAAMKGVRQLRRASIEATVDPRRGSAPTRRHAETWYRHFSSPQIS